MGLKDILGGLVGAVPGGSAVKAAVGVISKFVETPEDKKALAEIADRAAERESEERKGQVEVNRQEAQHRTIFVAGWRPYIGWGLGSVMIAVGVAIAYRILMGLQIPDLQPLAPFFYTLNGMLGLQVMMRSRDKRLGTTR